MLVVGPHYSLFTAFDLTNALAPETNRLIRWQSPGTSAFYTDDIDGTLTFPARAEAPFAAAFTFAEPACFTAFLFPSTSTAVTLT